jgi:hypothetical protein
VNRMPGFTADLIESKSNRNYSGSAAIRWSDVNAIAGQFWHQSVVGAGTATPIASAWGQMGIPVVSARDGGPRPRFIGHVAGRHLTLPII